MSGALGPEDLGWTRYRGPDIARCIGAHPDIPGTICGRGIIKVAPGTVLFVRFAEKLWPALRDMSRAGGRFNCNRCSTKLELAFELEGMTTFPTSQAPG